MFFLFWYIIFFFGLFLYILQATRSEQNERERASERANKRNGTSSKFIYSYTIIVIRLLKLFHMVFVLFCLCVHIFSMIFFCFFFWFIVQ